MITVASSGNSTLNRTGAERQIAIRNLDGTNALTAKLNEDTVGFTVEASGRAGWRINNGIYTVQIIAVGSWEVTFGF